MADEADNVEAGENSAEAAGAGSDAETSPAVDWLNDAADHANEAVTPWLEAWVGESAWLQSLVMLGLVVGLAIVAHVVARTYLLWLVRSIARRVFRVWDQYLIERRVFQRLVPLAPAMVLHGGILLVPNLPQDLQNLVQRLALATMVLIVAGSLGAMYSAINDIYERFPVSAGRPIKGYLQVAKIVTYVFAGILILATLMGQEIGYFLGGLGAMTAIIMLIFRDTLLSFVAGVQLVNNDLVRVGDWISMPQFDADGSVVDISLNVVKVRNWDRTMTMIPTHKFLEHSFKNWRSMFEGGGRRIQRAMHIDMTTIRFLSEREIQRFRGFLLLKDYIEGKLDELEQTNSRFSGEAAEVTANVRHLTNIGTFRAYVAEYLRQNPNIHRELTFLVRQLEPTPQGLPIEIYVFCRETSWPIYEAVQSDIFDHLVAVVQEFGLRVFQEPSGYDLTGVGRSLQHAMVEEGRKRVASNGDEAD